MLLIANNHGTITCTLIGLFFLVRGEQRTRAREREEPESDCGDPDTGIAGAEVNAHGPMTLTAGRSPSWPHHAPHHAAIS